MVFFPIFIPANWLSRGLQISTQEKYFLNIALVFPAFSGDRSSMSYLFGSVKKSSEDEAREQETNRVESAAAMVTMRELCAELLDPTKVAFLRNIEFLVNVKDVLTLDVLCRRFQRQLSRNMTRMEQTMTTWATVPSYQQERCSKCMWTHYSKDQQKHKKCRLNRFDCPGLIC